MKAVYLSEVGTCQFFYLSNRKNAKPYVKSVFELKDSSCIVIYSNGHYDIISANQLVYIK